MRRTGLWAVGRAGAVAAVLLAAACESGTAGQGPQLGSGDTSSPDASASGDAELGDVGSADDASLDGSEGPDGWASSDVPIAEDVPGISDTPGDLDVPWISDTPGDLDVPWISDTPGDLDVPWISDTPGDLDVPWISDTPGDLDVPWISDTPGWPDIPDGGPPGDLPGPWDVPPSDVPPLDVPLLDVPPGDLDVDPAQDADAPPPNDGPAAFRLTSLHVDLPTLCYGDPCTDVTAYGNQVLDDLFSDPSEPADVLLELSLFEQPVAARLGAAVCERSAQGQILGCALDTNSPPDAFPLVVMGVGGACLGLPGECLFTANTLGSLAFQFGDYLLGLSEADVGLQVAGDEQSLPAGALEGFLPTKIAKTLAFNTLAGVISMDELLDYLPTEVVNGQDGWWIRFSFKAQRVPAL